MPRVCDGAARVIFVCCWYYAGESLHEIKIEADSNDITDYVYDGQPTTETAG